MVGGGGGGGEIGIVFCIDVAMEEEEFGCVKREILRVVAALPENVWVGLVTFGEMVMVHDLGFPDCQRVLLFAGDRELTAEKIKELIGIAQNSNHRLGVSQSGLRQGYLLPVSECDFKITTSLEQLTSAPNPIPGHRQKRATGAAISTSIALLEAFSPSIGGRVLVFTSGPATIGPGKIVETDLSHPLRTHRDIIMGHAPLSEKSRTFYNKLARRLSDNSIVLDLFACSLDQVGAYELKHPIETSNGHIVLCESFDSDQFKKCLRHVFKREGDNHLNINLDVTLQIVTSKEVKVSGALGPCMSLKVKNNHVSDKVVGQGGTSAWKLCTITSKTCLGFIFQIDRTRDVDPGPVLFIQFKTRYRHGSGAYRLRVTTAARRWTPRRSPELASGFDQEAAAAIMARLAISRAEDYHARDVVRWLDKMLIRFTARFGDYMPEDPSSFKLSSNLSLFPQFMYYLRRSQFIDIFNATPDETSFFRVSLNREGVVGSLIMIQPSLLQYSFDGPPVPVLLDISSVSPDVILVFDSYFHVVIHYGSKIAQWRKMGYDKDPSYESLRKLMEAPEMDVETMVQERIPVPKVIKCDQHGSQARYLLARLNPSYTQKNRPFDGSDIVLTDDVSLQYFLEHLQELAVQR